MGIFSRKNNRSRDTPETGNPQNSLSGSQYEVFFGGTTAGEYVNERSAMQMSAVYACVKILSESIAGLPLHLYSYKDGGGKEKAMDHSLYNLLHDEPNPEMTSFTFRETLMSHLLLWGNAYSQIIRNGKNEITALYPLLPDRMTVDRDKNGKLFYVYQKNGDESPDVNSGKYFLYPHEVWHIPGLGFDGVKGYSPIAMAKNAIGMGIACDKYGASFFANGANPGGVIEHPGTINNLEKLKKSWNTSYQGSGKAHKVAILEEGMKFNPISISNDHAQFLETRKFQVNEIARIFRVPPHMIGDLEKSSFSNIEHQSLDFVKYSLNSWIVRIEQSVHKCLLNPEEKKKMFAKFNLGGLLRGDYLTRMQGYQIARQNGWMSANDIHELEDMDPIPAEEGGDLYLINGNMLKLEDAGAYANKNGKGG